MSYKTFDSGGWGSARGRALTLFISLTTIVAALAAVNLSQASAADKQLSFSWDRGIINLGSTTGVRIIDPDLDPPDNPATLKAPLDESGNFSAPKSAFTFPVKTISALETGNSLLPLVDAKIDISATADVTGSFDEADGTAVASIPAQALITVYPSGSVSSVAKCKVSGFTLDMATEGVLTDPATEPPTDYDAAKFAPPSGAGAVVDNWESLPGSTIEGGSLGSLVCPAVDGLVGGPGGLWLSGTATVGDAVQPGPPVMEPEITSTPPAETNLDTAEFTYGPGQGETEQVTKYECRLDGSGETGWTACDSGTQSYSGLAAGQHKFEVRAGNDVGFGPAASYSWTVSGSETCPPGTTGTPPNCEQNQGTAKLGGLKVTPKKKPVKRGKNVVIKVKVVNAGDAAAKGVKVCVKAPKKLVKVKQCVSLGGVPAGNGKVAKFKVTVKRKAKKGKKAVLKFKATSANAGAKSGKATVKIK